MQRSLGENQNGISVIKEKTFKAGVVNMHHEQTVANAGAITMTESINEFDILLTDPMLDLK